MTSNKRLGLIVVSVLVAPVAALIYIGVWQGIAESQAQNGGTQHTASGASFVCPRGNYTLGTKELASPTLKDYAFASEAVKEKDTEAFSAMLADGRAYVLPIGTRVYIGADCGVVHDGVSVVLVDSGRLKGKTLLIATAAMSR